MVGGNQAEWPETTDGRRGSVTSGDGRSTRRSGGARVFGNDGAPVAASLGGEGNGGRRRLGITKASSARRGRDQGGANSSPELARRRTRKHGSGPIRFRAEGERGGGAREGEGGDNGLGKELYRAGTEVMGSPELRTLETVA